MRDWLVSRQRKWGTPIPVVNCLDCGQSSIVDEKKLPATNSTSADCCNHCGSGNVQLETDTLDTFFDSSWYFFRFLDVKNENSIYDPHCLTSLPVHTYIGGKEHGIYIFSVCLYVNVIVHYCYSSNIASLLCEIYDSIFK